MTDSIRITQPKEAELSLGGFSRRTFTYQKDNCAHRPQRVIAKGSLKILVMWVVHDKAK
ncbi:MAG: hypothetical protein M3M87_05575 [Thermoproteota archaeon]|nr:hypothetical protein [Thermoproteota archaeon]